jgi:hypothetical protein
MGQYFLVVNHSKKEYLNPDAFGDSIKSPIVRGYSRTFAVLEDLLKDRWNGDRIAVEGDYFSDKYLTKDGLPVNGYELADEEYADISEDILKTTDRPERISMFILFHDVVLYIRNAVQDESGKKEKILARIEDLKEGL